MELIQKIRSAKHVALLVKHALLSHNARVALNLCIFSTRHAAQHVLNHIMLIPLRTANPAEIVKSVVVQQIAQLVKIIITCWVINAMRAVPVPSQFLQTELVCLVTLVV